MYNFLLKSLIAEFRNQNMSSFALIFDEFKRLIYFYAARIGDDDAVAELTLFLIELLYNIDIERFDSDKNNSLKRYIAVAIKNKYIAISKAAEKRKKACEELLENQVFFDNSADIKLNLNDALCTLTERQRIIIIYKYIYCMSDFEIADLLGITRQAVNRIKNRGLAVLKEYYAPI